MKRLLLLDADVIIDLHTLDLFEKIIKTYNVFVTRTVLCEAQYFKKEGRREKISIADKVTVVDVAPECLNLIRIEAKEARLGIDPGELESIAYLNTAEEDLIFCTCDKAAITKRICSPDIWIKCLNGAFQKVKRYVFKSNYDLSFLQKRRGLGEENQRHAEVGTAAGKIAEERRGGAIRS